MSDPHPVEPFRGKITSIRFRHPREDRELEVRFESEEYDNVDAVFTSVNAVERLLVPFYEGREVGSGERLLREARRQALEDVCMILHTYRCTYLVPRIDWRTRSPIIL